jgi:charged multivesicular body protein 2A
LALYIMAFVFGGGQTVPKVDPIQASKRVIAKAIRGLSSEVLRMDRQEKQLIAKIRQAVKNSDAMVVKQSSTELVRLRSRKQGNYNMQSKFTVLSDRVFAVANTHSMSDSMRQMTSAMSSINSQVDLQAMTRIVANFEKQEELIEEKQDIMDEVLTNVGEVPDEGLLVDDAVNMILSELALEFFQSPIVHTGHHPQQEIEEDLERRIELLKH